MSDRLIDRINFAKIVTVLAIVFGVSLGLCGVTAALASQMRGSGDFLLPMGIIELIAMGLSAVALVVTVVVWVIASIVGGPGSGSADKGPLKLFEDAEDKKHRDRQ
jgi:hypothetical protein